MATTCCVQGLHSFVGMQIVAFVKMKGGQRVNIHMNAYANKHTHTWLNQNEISNLQGINNKA